MSKIEILLNGGQIVGSITLSPPAQAFPSERTAWGFRIQIPTVFDFRGPAGQLAQMTLENLAVVFYATGGERQIEIGTARYPDILYSGVGDRHIQLFWDWNVTALTFYERLRDGRSPEFHVTASGVIRHILPGEPGRQPCSEPHIYRNQGHVGYPREAWVRTLRDLNLRDAVLIEIPFSAEPPSDWEPVWRAIRDARDSFDAGGSTGWKNCVVSVRRALEAWQVIEKESHGPGWKRPTPEELKERTHEQRIDSLRWHLMQCAHLSAHTDAETWSRDDAVLVLTTLCALLAKRKP